MKIFLLLSLLFGSFSYGVAQSSPPLKIRETDGSPTKSGINTLIVPNGTLAISGTTGTLTTGWTRASDGSTLTASGLLRLPGSDGTGAANNANLSFGVSYRGIYSLYTLMAITMEATPLLGWQGDANTIVATGKNLVFAGNATYPFNDPDVGFTRPSAGIVRVTNASTGYGQLEAGKFSLNAVAFADLGTPANGTLVYCSDCTIANPCAGSGTGALAKRLNGVWVCN